MRWTSVVPAVLILLRASLACADDAALAKEHYDKGTTAYDLHQYVEAAKEYEAAYRLRNAPELLFNIAQAYRLGGNPEAAIGFYKSYLRRVPNSPTRGEVELRIIELQRAVDQGQRAKEGPPEGTLQPGQRIQPHQQAPTNEQATSARSESPAVPARPNAAPLVVNAPTPDTTTVNRRPMRIAGVSLMAGGGVLLVLGGAFVGLAKAANDDAGAGGVYHVDAEARRNSYQAADAVCFAIGGVAAATGILLYVLGRQEPRRFALDPIVMPGAAGARATIRF